MACFKPKPAWQIKEGQQPRFHFSNFQDYGPPNLEIPCGKCEGCRADQARDWGIRSLHESKLHQQNCFITLTYRPENYPADGKISKRDLQLFMKRLRKELGKPLRYIACGEYGENTRRAHYHLIIFGEDFRGLGYNYEIRPGVYGSTTLDRIWNQGFCEIGNVEAASCMYTAGYVNKKIGDADTFAIQSRKPAIARLHFDKHKDNWLRIGTVQINGHSHPMPRTYMRWLKDDPDIAERVAELVAKRQENTRTRTDQQLRAKRKNMLAQRALRGGSI